MLTSDCYHSLSCSKGSMQQHGEQGWQSPSLTSRICPRPQSCLAMHTVIVHFSQVRGCWGHVDRWFRWVEDGSETLLVIHDVICQDLTHLLTHLHPFSFIRRGQAHARGALQASSATLEQQAWCSRLLACCTAPLTSRADASALRTLPRLSPLRISAGAQLCC